MFKIDSLKKQAAAFWLPACLLRNVLLGAALGVAFAVALPGSVNAAFVEEEGEFGGQAEAQPPQEASPAPAVVPAENAQPENVQPENVQTKKALGASQAKKTPRTKQTGQARGGKEDDKEQSKGQTTDQSAGKKPEDTDHGAANDDKEKTDWNLPKVQTVSSGGIAEEDGFGADDTAAGSVTSSESGSLKKEQALGDIPQEPEDMSTEDMSTEEMQDEEPSAGGQHLPMEILLAAGLLLGLLGVFRVVRQQRNDT